ncbi:MAG: F0F1 ATP synthase subunit delta [Nevskia sp.]
MAELATMARPYAKAVFELARDEGRYADWSALVGGLAAAVRDPAVAGWIGHPAIGRGQLAQLLIEALGTKLSAEGANLVRVLGEYNRLKLAPAIAEEYEVLRAEAEKRIDVEVTTAVAVDAAQQKLLGDAIAKRLMRQVDVSWKTDAALLAGAVIRAGDLVIDGSVVGELDRLRQELAA